MLESSTGHSQPQEKKVAKWLYVSISVAVVVTAFLFLLIGQKTLMRPSDLDKAAISQPE